MKKFLLFTLVLYSIIVTCLLFSVEGLSFQIISRKTSEVPLRNPNFIDSMPTCVVDFDTSFFYHESYMCHAFMAYEYRSQETITTMTTYEAEIRGFEPCPLCGPAYKAYKILK